MHSDERAEEKLIPFCKGLCILAGRALARLSQGICQRVSVIIVFLHDIYYEKEIVKAGRIP